MKTGNPLPPRYLTIIPRKAYVRRLIWWAFRRYCLNEDRYTVTCRFTGPRPRATSQVSTLRANATSYRYYITTRQTALTAEKRQADKIRQRYLRVVA